MTSYESKRKRIVLSWKTFFRSKFPLISSMAKFFAAARDSAMKSKEVTSPHALFGLLLWNNFICLSISDQQLVKIALPVNLS